MQEYITRHLEARGLSSRASSPAGGEKGASWFLHPLLEDVLGETHGVMIYQEDVLQVAHRLAGMSLGAADSLRRSMSGKLRSAEAMARVRGSFLAGCADRGIGAAEAREVWRQIESFAGYAFCKAHSASYALLSFQVAWLKAHFPAAFMAAVISNGGGFYGAGAYVSEARRMGLKILLPDVNRSGRDYRGRGREVRMGLGAVGTMAASSIDALLAAREEGGPFTCLSDLRTRAGLGESEMEVLVRCGACDGFELTRPEMLWRLACGGPPADDLFPGAGGLDALVPRLPEYPLEERCRIEKEVFGFTVSRHLLELLSRDVTRGVTPARAMAGHVGRQVRMIGQAIAGKRVPVRKGGERSWMKFLSLEDLTGTFEATLFPRSYRRFAEQTLTEGPYLLTGRIESDHGVCSLNVGTLEVVS
jgi:DNA polymerase III alpha subunit